MSNALKFTKKEGLYHLIAEEVIVKETGILKFVVSDNGVGISENDKNKIFERFYKVQIPESINQEGTGIGLSIVKDLVEMHHGKIQVDSVLDQGQLLSITIPSGKGMLFLK